MPRTPDGPPPPPTVQRLRLRYAKRGRLRFASHRDFQRALERAMRRAGVPVAFSAGFTPHPKVSYAGAAPTGVASEAEYLELGLAERLDEGGLADLAKRLDEALPEGLDVVELVEARTPDLVARLEASEFRVELPGVVPSVAAEAVAALLAVQVVEVERLTKQGMRRFDVRGSLLLLEVPDLSAPCAILRLVVRHGTPTVRPDDVLTGLRLVAGPALPDDVARTARVTRLAQGPWDADSVTVGDPLAPDREPVRPGA